MREISTRADRIGFGIVVVLAVVGGVWFASNQNNDPTVSAQGLTAGIPASEAAQPTPVPTTQPVAMPVAQSGSGDRADDGDAVDVASLAVGSGGVEVPSLSTDATVPAQPADEETAASDSGPLKLESEQGAAAAASASTQAEEPATAERSPQPAATAVPNPQPAATAVPNPQPAATAVPNPQPVAAPVSAPADAPAGGTFTHTLTATVARPTLHTAPGGTVFTPTFNGTALPAVNPTVFGNALVYRVLAGQPGDAWAKVYVPARPNGTTAWVQTSQFNWGSSNRMLQINVANNTVTVFEGTNTLLTTSAVTGTTSSPTPLANGWVEEIMAGPSAAYGTKLISLGMFSETLNSFGGGIPKIALHGTNNPGLMGQYASNGCIRVRNEIINQIATMLPVGSKVVIVG